MDRTNKRLKVPPEAPPSDAPQQEGEADAYNLDDVDPIAEAPGTSDSDDVSSSSEEEAQGEPPSASDQTRVISSALPKLDWLQFGEVFVNPRTHKLHLQATGCLAMACGRSNHGLVKFAGRVFEEKDKCRQCCATKPIRSPAGMVSFLDESAAKRARSSA